ncbi:hypothetical protein D3C72_1366650 [compost metagenome]
MPVPTRASCSDFITCSWPACSVALLVFTSSLAVARMASISSRPTSVVMTNFQASSLPSWRSRTLMSISAILRSTCLDSSDSWVRSAGRSAYSWRSVARLPSTCLTAMS